MRLDRELRREKVSALLLGDIAQDGLHGRGLTVAAKDRRGSVHHGG